MFEKPQAHWIFPIALKYSEKQGSLPNAPVYLMPDSSAYWPDYSAHEEGRQAVLSSLTNRIEAQVFVPNQLLRMSTLSENLKGSALQTLQTQGSSLTQVVLQKPMTDEQADFIEQLPAP